MFIVIIATPDGTQFCSQHGDLESAKDAMLEQMESAGEETWGWVQKVEAFSAMVGGSLTHA